MKYHEKMKVISFLFLFLFSVVLSAQQKEEIVKCSVINDQSERLKCFDSLAASLKKDNKEKFEKIIPEIEILEDEVEEEVMDKELETKSSTEIIKDQREIIVSLKSRIQKISRQRDIEKQKRESKDLSISATIISVAYKSYKFRFKLDNEEMWQLTDTGKRAGLKEGDKIKIVPGTMNSYFLENSRGRFRVKKIN
ncbi:MAG: hypothetical protein CMM88_02905 [Rickettsiales bacterium]|nr:hypothetical protein [Rickettsiales bacterium]